MDEVGSLFLAALMNWIKAISNGVWRSLNGESSGILSWLIEYWIEIVVFLVIVGAALDFMLWFLRWRPYRLWFTKRRRNGGLIAQDISSALPIYEADDEEIGDEIAGGIIGSRDYADEIGDANETYIDWSDEQENMIDTYLENGEMFVLDDNGVKAECVLTRQDNGVYELKNIAVLPDCQRKGYGRSLINFLFTHYTDCEVMFVGTGDCPSTVSFYNMCGFAQSHRVKNFFTDNYDHPIFEDGKQLIDMVYLKRER